MIILTFDVSSSCIGYCLSENGNVKRYGFVDISKIDSEFLLNKTIAFKNLFDFPEIVDKIVIEESLKSFSYGLTSINTIITLAKMNASFSYFLLDKYKLYPEYINASSVRKIIGIKIDKKSSINKKQQIFDFVDKVNNLFTLFNRNDKIDKRNWDVSDAIAINMAIVEKNKTKFVI